MSLLIQAARPGLLLGEQPENSSTQVPDFSDLMILGAVKGLTNPIKTMSGFRPLLKKMMAAEQRLDALDSSSLSRRTGQYRRKLQSQPLNDSRAVELFAAIRVAARRTHGITFHAEQLFAGWAMLHGNIVEMSTGEGKTLTAALPAIAVALTGTPVHVITVNEYLVERDAESLAPLYEFFDLQVGIVTDSMSDDDRRVAYRADIVYCTNKQIVFDYLRDLQLIGSDHLGLKSRIRSLLSTEPAAPVMRGLCFAIVDEADSVMIDDARIPLILAEPLKAERSAITESTVALGMSRTLHEGADFRLQFDTHTVWLTETGLDAIRRLADPIGGVWRFERYRNELIRQALSALHLYKRDRNYLVHDGQVELIDESTGRVMPDRKLQHGMHRMLELKENCLPGDESTVKAALSFQNFFNRYRNLAGMSGTVHEVRSELRLVYGKDVVRIPAHKQNRRVYLPEVVFKNRSRQLAHTISEIKSRSATGQPLLIGTRTVELSEQISDLLHSHKLPHALLNARQDVDEANLIAKAGQTGAITVATNMAGRGTDIPLSRQAAALGGLHVINLEINESRRVDRQLYGRAARQGDPGSCQSLLSLRDDLVTRAILRNFLVLADIGFVRYPRQGQWFALQLIRYAQRRYERTCKRQRIAVFRDKKQLERQLAIGGVDP